MSAVPDRILSIADVLLGAAYADGVLAGEEEALVRRFLSELLSADVLPAPLEAHLAAFDPERFELAAAAALFADDPWELKRNLLELVAQIRDADGEIDFAEDEYLVSLGDALEVPREEFADLATGIEIEELRTAFTALTRPPPPLPTSA